MNTSLVIREEEVICIDNFLAGEICAEMLRELRFSFWQPSGVMARSSDGAISSRQSQLRRSETTMQEWFGPKLQQQIEALEQRIQQTFGIPSNHLESWQVTRYQPGDGYEYHVDAGYHRTEAAGDREYTLLLYIQSPKAGGATSFRDLRLEFEARAGSLLAWRNLTADGSTNHFMSHAALPVIDGEKTILVTWARERPLRPPN